MFKLTIFFLVLLVSISSCSEHIPAADKGYEIIGAYAKKKNKSDGWGLSGIGGIYDDQIEKINISFMVDEQLDVNRARVILVRGIEEFLEMINANPRTEKFLYNRPFTFKNLEFCLLFNSNNESIVCANLVNGNLIYGIQGKKRFELAHKETYEEALLIVNSQDKKEHEGLVQSEQD